MSAEKATCLYRYFDNQDQLLYVGITSRGSRRFKEHESTQPWWAQVARATVEHHGDRDAALEAEREAIRCERPAYNVAGTQGRDHNRIARDADPFEQMPFRLLYALDEAAALLSQSRQHVKDNVQLIAIGRRYFVTRHALWDYYWSVQVQQVGSAP